MAQNDNKHAKKVDYDGAAETVFYTAQPLSEQERGNHGFYNNIDWLALSKQKLVLAEIIDKPSPPGDKAAAICEASQGLWALVDSLQADAQDLGYPVVWHTDTDTWLSIEREQNSAREVIRDAAEEMLFALKRIVGSAVGGYAGPDSRTVDAGCLQRAKDLIKRLEAAGGATRS